MMVVRGGGRQCNKRVCVIALLRGGGGNESVYDCAASGMVCGVWPR